MASRRACRRSIDRAALPKRPVCGRAAQRAAWLLVVGVLLAANFLQSAHAMRRETLKLHTAQSVHAIDVEVTETPEEKAQGLMFRTRLADKNGMLFFYETPQEITMWMRNTYIPLDMVFIRADGVVHRIEARTEPLSENIIASRGDVTACLELAGGAAERLGLKPGDRVEHRFFQPRGKPGKR
jgi:uncharacterized membrane protein (UPF0127 family)